MIPKPRLISDLIIDGGSGAIVATSSSGNGIFAVDQNMVDNAGKPDEPLEALDASVMLNIDGASSSATIRLPKGTNIDGRAYIRMYTVQGFAGVFRTRSPQIGYGGNSTTLQLEHAINELGDYIIADKITAKKKVSLKSALQTIFKYYHEKSSLWTLGDQIDNPSDSDVEDWEVDCVLEVDYDNCLEALEGIMEQYPSMMLEFDFSSIPWKLNVRNRPKVVTAEGRLSRNVKSATVTRDDSELYTRVYMDGYNNSGGKYGSYTSTSARKKYGLIETVISGANETKEIAQRTVKSYMRNHKNPKVSVTIEAIDLCNMTGESFDRFTIGKLCRLALPDYGETVSETLTSLSFPSVYNNPNSCTVTLNSEEDRVIKYIKKAQKSASKAAKSAASVGKAALVKAEIINTNTLRLTHGDGTYLDFKKAVFLRKDPSDNGGWKNGIFTVRAFQKNTVNGKEQEKEVASVQTKLTDITLQANKTPRIDGKDIYLPLKVMFAHDGYAGNTEYTKEVKADGTAIWNAGFDKAASYVKFPSKLTSGTRSKITFQVPVSTILGRVPGSAHYALTASPIASSNAVANIWALKADGTTTDYAVAKIDIGYIFDAVSITYLGLANNYSPLGDSAGDTRYQVFIETDISNGKKITDKLLTLASTTYNNGNNRCVNLKDGDDVIGRINIDAVYNAGRNELDGDWIDLNGSSASTSNTKPTTAVDRSDPAKIKGYIWLEKSDSKWKNLRSFTINTNADHLTVPLYYLSGGTYHKCTANKLYYYTN